MQAHDVKTRHLSADCFTTFVLYKLLLDNFTESNHAENEEVEDDLNVEDV